MRIRSFYLRPFAFAAISMVALISACQMYVEFNPSGGTPVDIIAVSQKAAFGTSTDSLTNTITFNGDNTYQIYARNDTNNAGKIAGSEDGITFLYKEVDSTKNFKLSANIRINHFGGVDPVSGATTSNGQEGFGLMARDYVPTYRETGYFAGESGGAGNMVMVGGIKRGVRAAIRRGVTGTEECVADPLVIADSSKSVIEWLPKELGDYSSYPTLEDRPDFPPKNTTYKLTLEKNNSGFKMTILPPADKGVETEYFYPYPDILTVIKKDKYYVGFFAARSADITVSNVNYYESNQSDDAPRIEEEAEIFAPSFRILSTATDSDGSYKIVATANVKGYLTVKQDGRTVPGADYAAGTWLTEPTSAAVEPFSYFEIPVYNLKEGENSFQIVFYPEDDQSISNNAPIQKTFLVNKKSFLTRDQALYVSPYGSKFNTGALGSPLDLDTAIAYVLPGQKIIMLDGIYKRLSVVIPRFNNGLYGAVKRLEAQHRDQVFIDFDKNYNASGFICNGNYWEFSGFHVRNTPDKVKGITILGNNNLMEWVKTYNNGDTGLQISGRSTEPKSMWAKNNTIAYCESYDNMDAAMNDADGFAAKLTVGEGNVFNWCVAHNNCDDGWDLFTKKETGTIGAVTITNCVAYQNGTLMNGMKTLSGRNGFKLGGEGLSVPHVLENCLSFNNGAHGITANSNPAILLRYCTSFNNGGSFNLKAGADSRNFAIYDGANTVLGLSASLTGILSLYSQSQILVAGTTTNRREDKVELKLPADGFAWMGAGTGNTPGVSTKDKNGNILTVADSLVSTAIPLWDVTFTTRVDVSGFIKRKTDGTFDIGDFLRLKTGAFPGTYQVGCRFY